VLNHAGEKVEEYKSIVTPHTASPKNVIATIKKLVANFKTYDHISVGFPGFVKKGIVQTAPNLGSEMWKEIKLESGLRNSRWIFSVLSHLLMLPYLLVIYRSTN
jgi:polyphosphate glucokinase